MDKLHTYDSTKLQIRQHKGMRLHLLLTVLLLALGINGAWADDTKTLTLASIDFTSSEWQNATITEDGATPVNVNGVNVYFKGDNNFSISSDGLTMSGNNMSAGKNGTRFLAIPLTGINRTATVTIDATTDNAQYYYDTSENTNKVGTPSNRNSGPASRAKPPVSFDITSASGKCVLYLGRSSSNFKNIKSITITTADSSYPEFVTPTTTALVAGESKVAVDYLAGATTGSLYYKTSATELTLTEPTATELTSETSGWSKAERVKGTDARFNFTVPNSASTGTLYVYAVGIADDASTVSNVSSKSYTVLNRPSAVTVTWNTESKTASDISWDSGSPALSDVTISATNATGVIYRWASGKAVESNVTGEEFASMSFTKGDNTFDSNNKATLSSNFSGTNTTRTLTFYTYNKSGDAIVYQSAPTFVTWTLKGANVNISVIPEQSSIVAGGSTKFSVTAKDDNGTDITSLLSFTYSVDNTNATIDASNLTVTAGSSEGSFVLTATSAATTTYKKCEGNVTIKIDNASFKPEGAELNVATNSTIYGDRDVRITNSQGGVTYYYRIDEGESATNYKDWSATSSDWQSYSQYISLTAPDETTGSKKVVVSIAAVNTTLNTQVAYSSYTYTMSLYDAPSVSFKANDADVATTSYNPPVTVTISTAQATDASDNTVKTYYYVRPDGNETTPTKDNPQLWTEYSGALTINEASTVYAYADGDATKSSEPTSVTINIKDDRNQPGISWPTSSVEKTLGTTDTLYTGQVLNNINAVEVVYSSSNPTVASINQDGIVHINGVGTTTIVATYTSPSTSSTYRSQAASYTLTVSSPKPSLSFYSHSTDNELSDGQSVPDGTVVKLNMKNFPSNYVVMVALNGNTPTYPKDKEPDKNYDNNFHYLGRGIPVFTTDNSSSTVEGESTANYSTIHVRIFDPSTKAVVDNGTYDIKLKVESYNRPDKPKLSPTSITEAEGNATVLTTAESSTATGDVGNMVYAKYSNSLTYSPRVLLAERNISIDTTSVGVFSTVYNPYRRTTAIQIKENVSWTGSDSKTGTYDISSDAAVVYYHYTPKRHKTSINAGENIIKDLTTDASNLTQEITPKYYVDGVESALPTNPGSAKYSVKSSNATVATVSIDESTNKVTVTANAVGTAIISISTNQVHGTAAPKNDDGEYVGTQGYDAAETTVRVTVTDVASQKLLPPTIDPPTFRVYHSTLEAVIKANVKANASDDDKTVGDAYYLIQKIEKGGTVTDYSTNKDGIRTSAEHATESLFGGKISVGNSATIAFPNLGDGKSDTKYVVWMVTYNPENNNKYSDVDSVTYVYKYISVPDPVLTPGVKGIDNEYTFSGDSLVVTASVSMAGASVYYSIDKEGDVKTDSEGSTLYDGKERITLKRSCTVRAVAYYDGVYSHTVVYNYRKTKINIDYPFYIDQSDLNVYRSQVNNIEIINPVGIGVKTECRIDADGDGQWDRNSDNADDYKYYRPDDDDYDGAYAIRYTTGTSSASTPTPTMTNSEIWDEDMGLSFTTNTTIKAFCYNVNDGSAGPVSTLTLTFNPGAWPPWEALKNKTCDANGKLYDQVIDKNEENHNTSSAPQFIRMTIGSVRDISGTNKSTWSHGDVAGDYKGNRIEGFGDCDIIAKAGEASKPTDRTNAEDEELTVYNHSYAQLPDTAKWKGNETKADGVYQSTFKLPAHGTFVRFEPERDGTVYIWCVMNGGMQWSKNGGSTDIFFNKFIKKRPVYLVDEQGHAVGASHIQAAGTLDKTNWNSIDRSKLLGLYEKEEASYETEQADPTGKTSGTQKNRDFTYAESQDIYDMYNEKIRLVSDNSKSITDLVTTLNDGTHQTAAGAGTKVNGDNVIDDTGYCIPSSSYMKFAFPLKAGKTYFFFMVNSKVGISALGYKADNTAETVTNNKLTLDETSESALIDETSQSNNAAAIDAADTEKTYDVTVKHSFTKGLWTTLVLPFSVSEKQLKKELGDGVDVIHFTEWDATNKVIKMTRHYYNQMIVAGTPVFIKPDVDATSVMFTGVHIEKPNKDFTDGVENVPASSTDVHMTGNFDKGSLSSNDFYINTRGRLTQLTKSESMNINGMRAWLTGFSGTVANAKAYVAIVNDSETGDVDGIIRVTVDEDGNITGEDLKDNIIYNLSGQIVTRDPSRLNTLPRGIYILNGKKVTVK